MTSERCESCGHLGEDLLKVQRIYLLPPEGAESASHLDSSEFVPSAGDIEMWCASCCGMFPHTLVEETTSEDSA